MGLMDSAAYYAWLKQYISTHLKENEHYEDEQILSALEEVEQYIKNYCRIPRVPNALKYVWANLALDLLRTQFPKQSGGGGAAPEPVMTGVVKAVVRGDTEVSFDADPENAKGFTHSPSMDDLVYNYLGILQRFRMYQ